MSATGPVNRVTAALGRPVIDYFNEQFEAVKQEVRLQVGEHVVPHVDERLDRLRIEMVAAIDALAARSAALERAVEELRLTNDRILAVAAEQVGLDDPGEVPVEVPDDHPTDVEPVAGEPADRG